MSSLKFIFFLLILFPLIQSCRKTDKNGTLQEPGIALTFDDNYVNNWYSYLPLLDSLGVRATFYISNYHNLTATQVQKLKTIEAHGNEIGYHTTHHVNIPKYLDEYGANQLFSDEIEPDLKKMKQDGFKPRVFAYPYGAHTISSNNLLSPQFKSLRLLNGSPNWAKSLTASSNETILYGMEMDNSGNKKEWMYEELIHSAKENGNCFVVVGHRIEDGNTNLKVPLVRLLGIIKKVKELNMKFYTVSEISAK